MLPVDGSNVAICATVGKGFFSRGSRNSFGGNRGLTEAWAGRKLIRAYAESEEAAWPEIAAQVIAAGWENVPDVMTDTDYDAMQVEIARDAE